MDPVALRSLFAVIEARRTQPDVPIEFPRADLCAAHLMCADLRGANLKAARIEKANLAGASLMGACLDGASLSRTDLTGADLRGADLSGATLAGAILTAADLRGAKLSNTLGSPASIANARLDHAFYQRSALDDTAVIALVVQGARIEDPHLFSEAVRNVHAGVDTGPESVPKSWRLHELDIASRRGSIPPSHDPVSYPSPSTPLPAPPTLPSEPKLEKPPPSSKHHFAEAPVPVSLSKPVTPAKPHPDWLSPRTETTIAALGAVLLFSLTLAVVFTKLPAPSLLGTVRLGAAMGAAALTFLLPRWGARVVTLRVVSVTLVAALAYLGDPSRLAFYRFKATLSSSESAETKAQALRYLVDSGYKNFDGLDLSSANLSGMALDHSSFRGTSLAHANLSQTSLVASVFDGSIVSYTAIHGSDLSKTNIDHAIGWPFASCNDATRMPEGTVCVAGRPSRELADGNDLH